MTDDPPALRLAATIIEVVRAIVRTTPAPRGAPFFCIDSDVWYDLDVLDSFFAHGIFRKYEFAVDLGCGLGGRARWLAARSGCRVLGVDPSLDVVRAAALLNGRSYLTAQVGFRVGRLEALPLRGGAFTHAWMVISERNRWQPDILAEAFRVLRPGGTVALQTTAGETDAERVCEALLRLGFGDLERRQVALTELPLACRAAHDRVRAAWGDETDADLLRKPPGVPRAVQLFARRPA